MKKKRKKELEAKGFMVGDVHDFLGFAHGENYLGYLRQVIEMQYRDYPTGCGGSFGELLCYEIHEGGLTFMWLAEKWGISLPTLGELIWDHCKRLEELPQVNHNYPAPADPPKKIKPRIVLDKDSPIVGDASYVGVGGNFDFCTKDKSDVCGQPRINVKD